MPTIHLAPLITISTKRQLNRMIVPLVKRGKKKFTKSYVRAYVYLRECEQMCVYACACVCACVCVRVRAICDDGEEKSQNLF